MRFPIWLKGNGRRRGTRGWERGIDAEPEGDSPVSYGFGHHAHQPDPNAEYMFETEEHHRAHNPGASYRFFMYERLGVDALTGRRRRQ